MSNYALRIPDSLFEYARKCAEDESVSMNQFFVMAIAEKVSALKTAEYFAARVEIANPRRAADILRKVADRPPETDDEIMPVLEARQTRAAYTVKDAVAAKRTASSRKRTRR